MYTYRDMTFCSRSNEKLMECTKTKGSICTNTQCYRYLSSFPVGERVSLSDFKEKCNQYKGVDEK